MNAEATLRANLAELQEQWRQSAMAIRSIDTDGAAANMECAEELRQILDGDLRPIEKR